MIDNLEQLGLTENESKIYIFLLKHPSSTGSEIRKLTAITNSQVYATLDKLIKKGMASFQITPKGRIFSATDPQIISETMKEKQKYIENIVPKLKEMQKFQKNETKSVIYEGFNGFKNAFLRLVDECPKGETIYIIGFSNQAYKNEQLRLLLSNVNTRSIEKKHKFKMILDDKENSFYQDRKVEKISQIRFMNNNFKSPAAIDIFLDKVYIFLWDENPYAFMIQNKNIANGFKNYFQFLWSMAQK